MNQIIKDSLNIKACLFFIWILWALQLFGFVKDSYIKEREFFKNRNFEEERRLRLDMYQLEQKTLNEAAILKDGYGPKEYFNHLRQLKDKENKNHVYGSPSTTSELNQQLLHNIRSGKVSQSEVENEAKLFKEWNELQISHFEEFRFPKARQFLKWLEVTYFRSIPLVFVWYLVRMRDRRGILETVLAGKLEFVYSIIFWPAFFFKYPYNVIREIRVEAELRRFKNFFRILSLKEVRLIREVASSPDYYVWIKRPKKYQRGLVLALVATIFIHLFLPTTARAREPDYKVLTGSIKCFQVIKSDSLRENQSDSAPCTAIIEEHFEIESFSLIGSIIFTIKTWKSRFLESLDVIPRNALFGVFVMITNQIRKGITNEKDNNDYCFSFISKYIRCKPC